MIEPYQGENNCPVVDTQIELGIYPGVDAKCNSKYGQDP